MQKPYLKLSATVPAPAPASVPSLPLYLPKFPQEQYAAWQLNLTRPALPCSVSASSAARRVSSQFQKKNPILHTPCSFPEQATPAPGQQLDLAGAHPAAWSCLRSAFYVLDAHFGN